MSAETPTARDAFAEQLSSFDDRLHATTNDVDMLSDIQDGIARLLSDSGNSEAEIRQVLQDRYENGNLRKETFQLVKSMLDRFVSEQIPTSPTNFDAPGTAACDSASIAETADLPQISASNEPAEDGFSATTVIPADFMASSPVESRVQIGSLLRDRFLLQERVSGGSMGVVYKAMDRRMAEAGSKDHWVAIKVLSPQLAENGQALRALQQEAAKGRCLVHPNIVRFIDLDRDDDLYFLVMEWLEGRTLAEILDSKDASVIDTTAAFRIVRQVGEALDYAHSRGIVHADIKPGNIMIMPNGDAKLFDFGVARVRQQHAEVEFEPSVLSAVTPAYSSMQVLTDEEPVATDDVFSLSCLMYRLVAGYRVFGPRNAAEASQEGMKPQRLTDLNDRQWSALKKGLSYSRVTRFSSVREFVDALSENTQEPFRVDGPDRLGSEEDEKKGGQWTVILLLLVVIAAGFAYQQGYFDATISSLSNALTERQTAPIEDTSLSQAAVADDVNSEITEIDQSSIDESVLDQSADSFDKDVVADTVIEEVGSADETINDVADESDTLVELEFLEPPAADDTVAVGPDSMLVNFATLPPATEVIPFTPGRTSGRPVDIALREDGADYVIDFVRGTGLATPLTLRLEEVGFSGNRSPWASGQYALSNSGLIHFPAGQSRGRVSLTMVSDQIREADQQSVLRVRNADFVDSELVVINVNLEDDDRRNFESRLPSNTVGFAMNLTSIRESDPAIQIDLIRFNPDNSAIDVRYGVSDITATEGLDYFAPGDHIVSFGPAQRSARLLIPLVQDADVEGDEAFVVELTNSVTVYAKEVHDRIVVTIRDDEPQSR